MQPSIHIETVSPQTLAVVRGRANSKNISERIIELLNKVWEYIRATNIPNTGHNVVVYFHTESESRFDSEEGVPVEVGVQITAPFTSDTEVICSTTPGGIVATAIHIGSYARLGETHEAVHVWCRENGHTVEGTVWEVYGHWTENTDALQTDVFYLLK